MPPRFVPPIRHDLLDLVAVAKLQPLDLVLYLDVLAHSANWVVRNKHPAERYGVGLRAVERSVARLKRAELLSDGDRDARGSSGPSLKAMCPRYEGSPA